MNAHATTQVIAIDEASRPTMKRTILTSVLYTLITGVALGIGYPLIVTGLAHVLFPRQAAGSLIYRNGTLVGSHLIGQPFTGPGYFWSRPSAAGTGYDASASSGSNYAPTNAALITRINASVKTLSPAPGTSVPVDLVTASASGLDPDISPAAALYQVPRVAAEHHLPEDIVRGLVAAHITPRQFGILGEPRVNVLDLNLAINDLAAPARK
jgi:K+-transporting ATPase ATPase C chain